MKKQNYHALSASNAVALTAFIAAHSSGEAEGVSDARHYVEMLDSLQTSVIELLARRLCPKNPANERAVSAAVVRYRVARTRLAEMICAMAEAANISFRGHTSYNWIAGGSFEPDIHNIFGQDSLPVRRILSEVCEALKGGEPPLSVFSAAMSSACLNADRASGRQRLNTRRLSASNEGYERPTVVRVPETALAIAL